MIFLWLVKLLRDFWSRIIVDLHYNCVEQYGKPLSLSLTCSFKGTDNLLKTLQALINWFPLHTFDIHWNCKVVCDVPLFVIHLLTFLTGTSQLKGKLISYNNRTTSYLVKPNIIRTVYRSCCKLNPLTIDVECFETHITYKAM